MYIQRGPYLSENLSPSLSLTVRDDGGLPGPGDLFSAVLSFLQGTPAMEYAGPGGGALMLIAAVIGPGLWINVSVRAQCKGQ